MSDEDKALLDRHGWVIECESPPEVSRSDGMSASGKIPVDALVWMLKEEEQDESDYDRGYYDGEQGTYGANRRI